MEYKKVGKCVVARIDKGEEILSVIEKIAVKETVMLGRISAIGAVNKVKLGLFKTKDKEYLSKEYKGDFEIVSLAGNISTMTGNSYIHAHLIIADSEQKCFGGHCNYAYVSATCELIIDIISDNENEGLDREFSDEIGLNLFKF